MRILVVGAGLAGMTAATRLREAGADVVVLEARQRVGGRTWGRTTSSGACIDAGGAYLGSRHTRLINLAQTLGLELRRTSTSGKSRFAFAGARSTASSRFPPLNATSLGQLFDLLDELVKRVDIDAPWLTPAAAELDRVSAAQWLEEGGVGADARVFFPIFLGEMMAAAPEQVSALHMAFYLAAGGGLEYMNDFEGGAQESRIVGGAHQLCERMAAQLNGRILLGCRVRELSQASSGVNVGTDSGSFAADAAVVAIPPVLAEAMAYRPTRPAPRASPRTVPGCAIKVHLLYPEPLWRQHGLSGWSVSDEGPLQSTIDDSAEDCPGVLTGFITGQQAISFAAKSRSEQGAAVASQLRHLFPELPPPDSCEISDWLNEPFSRGCYAALLGPGAWMEHGENIDRPHGRIHWAGTETSHQFFGLMEGAVRSGERAAAEVLSSVPA